MSSKFVGRQIAGMRIERGKHCRDGRLDQVGHLDLLDILRKRITLEKCRPKTGQAARIGRLGANFPAPHKWARDLACMTIQLRPPAFRLQPGGL